MADLATIAKNAAAVAFSVAGTAKTTATLHIAGTAGSYDPETNQNTTTGGSDVEIEGILYSPRQVQGSMLTGFDAVFVFQGVDAPEGVDEASTITVDGKLWNIAKVMPVPTQAIIQLGLRR